MGAWRALLDSTTSPIACNLLDPANPPRTTCHPSPDCYAMRGSLLALAEAVKAAASSRLKSRSPVELTDSAASRIKELLETRHKVREAGRLLGPARHLLAIHDTIDLHRRAS
jgi:hypothetical protein